MREIFTYGSVGRASGNRCLYPEEGPGYLRGVLESMWFRKLYLLSELLGFKSPAPQLPVSVRHEVALLAVWRACWS